MKKAFKAKRTYIISAILLFVGLILPYGILGITLLPNVNSAPFRYYFWHWIACVLYVLIGYVCWDLHRVRWRRKTKTWDGPVDPVIKEESWSIATPFFLSALIILVAILVTEFIAIANGGVYPLLG